jgi:hypothetical protein
LYRGGSDGMTGFVVQARRNGMPTWVDIDELTDAELERVELPADDGWIWAIGLAKWIRDHHNPGLNDRPVLRLHQVVEEAAAAGG